MSAPWLVVLGTRSDRRAARAAAAVATATRALRRDLHIDSAVAGTGSAGLEHVTSRLARRGAEEIVAIPLDTSPAAPAADIVAAAATAARAAGVHLRLTAPLGADPALLNAVDARLREALSVAHVHELDAVVLAAPGSADPLVTESMSRLARVWSQHHHLPTSVAYASISPPSTGEAVREWHRRGKRHIAVATLFATESADVDLATELALEAGACAVAAPLGAHEEVSRVVLARYSVGALALVPV